ncbi:putative HVA22-like protein g [Rutidosis leptorrhynchoides]|uniref:putative HVA22-like protein g n=1 Tax=Rutidosis leptorrhynchoides TaxID=125765 RepID=UPI003A99081A
MIGSFLARGLVMVFGYAYPAYECFKSVEKNKPDIEQLRFWCQYWILVAVLTVSERIGDTFISWVPMYSEAKLAFYIYLWYPKTKGTAYVYDSFFRPYISKHETDIDRNLSELRTMAADVAVSYWQRAASYAQTRTLDIIQYVASQSTPKPQPQPQSQPKQPAKVRQPVPNLKKQTAIHEDNKEPPSPVSSSSLSSSSSSSSHEMDQSDAEGPTQVSPKPTISKVQKASSLRNLIETAKQDTTTETETAKIERSSSLNVNPTPAPKESIMDEPVRLTRARLRKASSIQ